MPRVYRTYGFVILDIHFPLTSIPRDDFTINRAVIAVDFGDVSLWTPDGFHDNPGLPSTANFRRDIADLITIALIVNTEFKCAIAGITGRTGSASKTPAPARPGPPRSARSAEGTHDYGRLPRDPSRCERPSARPALPPHRPRRTGRRDRQGRAQDPFRRLRSTRGRFPSVRGSRPTAPRRPACARRAPRCRQEGLTDGLYGGSLGGARFRRGGS